MGSTEVWVEHSDRQLATVVPEVDAAHEAEPETDAAHEADLVEGAEVPRDYFFARFGTFMLVADDEAPSPDVLRQRLETAIRTESRIASAMPVAVRGGWTFSVQAFPKRQDTTDDALFSGKDAFKAIRLSDPVAFIVTVPIKNQPEFRGYNDIPTDTYYVAWDGITAFVLWRRLADDRMPPRSGGRPYRY
jgi:hypothetical protein